MAKDIMENGEMTEEAKRETYRKYENDILGGLLAAASFKTDADEITPVEIYRNGNCVLTFHIRPLSEEEYLKARRDNTVYKRNKSVGTRVVDHVNTSAYRSQLIYDATIEEDRDKIWNNRTAWDRLNVVNGIDLIDVVLKSGEKDMIIDKLDEISGYQLSMEETSKN